MLDVYVVMISFTFTLLFVLIDYVLRIISYIKREL